MPSRTELWSVLFYVGPILVLITIYALALAWFYRFGGSNKYVEKFLGGIDPPVMLAITNSGGVYLIVLAVSAQFAQDRQDFGYAVAAATAGLALGWIVGIIISPASTDEAAEFSLLTKAVSTLLTGYVLGYLKDVKAEQIGSFLSRPGIPFRIMIGAACCFSTIAAVFVSRRAEAVRANRREWFVGFAPPDSKHPQALRADVLARGPFFSREEALAEIQRIKDQDEFKSLTLTPVRVDFFSGHAAIAERAAATAAPGGGNANQPGASANAGGTAASVSTNSPSGAAAGAAIEQKPAGDAAGAGDATHAESTTPPVTNPKPADQVVDKVP
jgi:hypothetical protein